MSFFLNNWLPTLLGGVVFVGFAIVVLTVLSALASKIEERFAIAEEQDLDMGMAA